MERSLITTDRWKKPLHKTGRDWGGGVRRLAEISWVAAKVLEEYFSGWGFSPEKCGV